MALTDNRGANALHRHRRQQQTLEAGIQIAACSRMVIIAQPKAVYKDDPSFTIDPGYFMHRGWNCIRRVTSIRRDRGDARLVAASASAPVNHANFPARTSRTSARIDQKK